LQKYETFVEVIFFIKSRIIPWLPREKFRGHKKKKKRKENIAAKDVKFGIEMGRKDMKYTV
jgi:hypothetical protein